MLPNVLFAYELPKILLESGGLPAGVVDFAVNHVVGGTLGVVDGACMSELLPFLAGVLYLDIFAAIS